MPHPRLPWLVATLALLLPTALAAGADVAPVCGEAPGVYRGENGRQAWILRAGTARNARKGGRAVHVYDAVFDGGDAYTLYGAVPARLLLAPAGGSPFLERLDWFDEAGGLPRGFQLVGDDGTAGPTFRFTHCEPDAPPAARARVREFWE